MSKLVLEKKTLQEVKSEVAAMSQRIVAARGESFLKGLYAAEGIEPGSTYLGDFLTMAPIIATEAAKLNLSATPIAAVEQQIQKDLAECQSLITSMTPAAPAGSIPTHVPAAGCSLPTMRSGVSMPIQKMADAMNAARLFVQLTRERKFDQAAELRALNQESLEKVASTWRAATPEEANLVYALLLESGESLRAGKFWARNRELLQD